MIAAGAQEDQAVKRARGALAVGGSLLLLGLSLVGIGPSDVGVTVTLTALLVMIFGIHTFGRLGPDLGPPLAKKRKKKRPTSPVGEAG